MENTELTTPGKRLKWARKKLGLSQGELAQRCRWSADSQSRISHYERDQRGIDRNDAMVLAEALEVTPDWLLFGQSGFLRQDEVRLISSETLQEVASRKIPVLTWQDAKNWKTALQVIDVSKQEFIPCLEECSEDSFGLVVKNDVMIATSPYLKSFLPGEYIVIDPHVAAQDNDHVAASIGRSPDAVFMQYVVVAGVPYLKPLNPQYDKIKMDDTMAIIGVVVGYYGKFKK